MTQEIALFWAVLAGFLFADNLVWLPRRGDYLRLGLAGALSYAPGLRFQARRRDLLLLNPLNPFDRVAITGQVAGVLDAAAWRAARRQVRSAMRGVNRLSALGVVYLLALAPLLFVSFHVHFGVVLALLAAVHVSLWLLALWILVASRQQLGLSRQQTFTLAAEALFVPAYTLNLGKRVWFKQVLALPALAVGIRQCQQMPAGDERELYASKLTERLEDWALDIDIEQANPAAAGGGLSAWVKEVRQCLKASAAAAGS